MEFEDIAIKCPACREKQWLEVDSSEGDNQELIQDCEVCCRPMRIQIRRDGSRLRADVALADGF